MKNVKRIVALLMVFTLAFISGGEAYETVWTKYNQKKVLKHENGKYYQEAFYDYGTIMPGDNARIYGVCRGYKQNYAIIKYADKGNRNFIKQSSRPEKGKEAYVNYTSRWDYLEGGSYAYTWGGKGAAELDLGVRN